MLPQAFLSAIWAQDRVIAIREIDVPCLLNGEVLIRVRAAGICGSDLHQFRLNAKTTRMPNMGPGHELAGEIVALGPGVTSPPVGSRVTCFAGRTCKSCGFCLTKRPQLCTKLRLAGQNYPGGMGEYFVAQAEMVYLLPVGIDWPVAALSEPLSVAIHGMKRASITNGQRVLVIGAGTIGLLAALVAIDAGAAHVALVARHEHQVAAAWSIGAHEVFGQKEFELQKPSVARKNWDLVVESVGGISQTLQQAIDVVACDGTVLLLGVHHVSQSIMPARLFRHELRIVGAFGCNYLGPCSDFDQSVGLIRKYQNLVAPLVTHTFPLESASAAFATALDKRSGAIKVSILP